VHCVPSLRLPAEPCLWVLNSRRVVSLLKKSNCWLIRPIQSPGGCWCWHQQTKGNCGVPVNQVKWFTHKPLQYKWSASQVTNGGSHHCPVTHWWMNDQPGVREFGIRNLCVRVLSYFAIPLSQINRAPHGAPRWVECQHF
jgi:hypothetical protein